MAMTKSASKMLSERTIVWFNIYALYLTRDLASIKRRGGRCIEFIARNYMHINWEKLVMSLKEPLPQWHQRQRPSSQKHESHFRHSLIWKLFLGRNHWSSPKQLLIRHAMCQVLRLQKCLHAQTINPLATLHNGTIRLPIWFLLGGGGGEVIDKRINLGWTEMTINVGTCC